VKLSRDIADCCRHLVEPEKTVAEAASAAISAALKAFIPVGAVKVSAFGSQSKYAAKDGPDVVTSSLMIEIEPIKWIRRMKARGDIESVNLRTGERFVRVSGNGESRLEPERGGREPLDIDAGTLEVGTNDRFEVIVNHPDLEPDENGVGHIVFSPRQARHFANLLLKHADRALQDYVCAGSQGDRPHIAQGSDFSQPR
jgi:hypothetical protein